jgi:hypothetical protein
MAGKVLDLSTLVKKGDYDAIKDFLDRVPNRMEKVALVNAPSASGSTALFGEWRGTRQGQKSSWLLECLTNVTVAISSLSQASVGMVERIY